MRGIRPTRSMGQNFLVEPDVVHDIVEAAHVESGDLVVEIGPGLGILTRALLGADADVVAVELDRELKRFLDHDLRDATRLRLVERDARHVDIDEITGQRSYHVVANLPYSVATVVIRHFMEANNPPSRMTVMVQREVAERMTASPPNMSLLSLATQLYAVAEIAFIVPKDVFLPEPNVESAVVRLELHDQLPLPLDDRDRLFNLATMAFQRKRKTISNGLSQGTGRAKSEIDEILGSIGVDPARRPQTIALDEWIALSTNVSVR